MGAGSHRKQQCISYVFARQACVLAVQTKTALSRMTRERESAGAQLTQLEQGKLVAEAELAEVRTILSGTVQKY